MHVYFKEDDYDEIKKEFKRKEHKYLIPEDLYETFISDLQHYMSTDKYDLHPKY
ncbi:hypothetical protein [Vagococcus teuberi]|uniref:hypothetical protein n=1 Tax=Vagococcus teuberi TaxID=519472 RepID=UPI0012EEC858|nr:hypothetical protein [Vagococcus teuberi]